MTLACHVAADRDESRAAEPVTFRAQQRGDHDVASRAEAAVHPHLDAVTQAVLDQDRLRFGEPELPG